jgi:hypothetical protein
MLSRDGRDIRIIPANVLARLYQLEELKNNKPEYYKQRSEEEPAKFAVEAATAAFCLEWLFGIHGSLY